YRLYVDSMMAEKEKEVSEMREMLLEKEDRLEHLLKQVVKVLAMNTEYATMITTPRYQKNKLKFIQLSRVDEQQLVAVIVVEGNIIRNNILDVSSEIDDETLLKLNILLNTNLNGLTLDEINLGMIASMKQQAGIHSCIIGEVLDAVAEAIKSDDDLEIYTSGANNIFKYPELSDHTRASQLITTLEEKKQLEELVARNATEENGIHVYIGDETPIATMKDCSVVTATYELEDGIQGTVGIIGPKRMDYEKVIHTLKSLMSELDAIYRKT
ncbi:MAG: HrcA family transcriptional regulator, partial [Lachnospiraceae bacterium]|nr:HrcA family transcriptional regulator [Lachnospiraceae bacterium]